MMKKYELTTERNEIGLYRIRALRDFGNVMAGDLGGWIEKEENLSHDGLCWVSDDAWVYENAWVRGDALVSEYAEVYGNAAVYGKAKVFGCSRVYGNSVVCGNAQVSEEDQVSGYSCVFGNELMNDVAKVFGNAHVYGGACSHEGTVMYGETNDQQSASVTELTDEEIDKAVGWSVSLLFREAIRNVIAAHEAKKKGVAA